MGNDLSALTRTRGPRPSRRQAANPISPPTDAAIRLTSAGNAATSGCAKGPGDAETAALTQAKASSRIATRFRVCLPRLFIIWFLSSIAGWPNEPFPVPKARAQAWRRCVRHL